MIEDDSDALFQNYPACLPTAHVDQSITAAIPNRLYRLLVLFNIR